MGLKGMGFSLFAIAAGAVMYWAITEQGHGFRLSTVGVILMVIGGIGFLVSAVVYGTSRPAGGSSRRTLDRRMVDAQGQSSAVHEEVR
jgi:predicted membrane channel-forming protein YqfA (hemolysin III family)